MKNSIRLTFASLILLISSSQSFAIEPKSPASLCERFLEGPDRSKCEKKISDLKPDWYLAAVCNDNFDDELFFECLNLNKLGSFSPEKLSDCVGDQLTDNARITCVRKAQIPASQAFQGTTPTSASKKKPAKKQP